MHFFILFISLVDIKEIQPAPGDHESNFKKVGAIPCGCNTKWTEYFIFSWNWKRKKEHLKGFWKILVYFLGINLKSIDCTIWLILAFVKNVSSSISHTKTSSLRHYENLRKILPSTFFYESILMKITKTTKIIKTQIFYKMKYDLKGLENSQQDIEPLYF